MGNIVVESSYDHFDAGGAPVGPSDDWYYRRPRVDINHNPFPRFIYQQHVELFPQPGQLENCDLTLRYETSERIACGSTELARITLDVQIPQVNP